MTQFNTTCPASVDNSFGPWIGSNCRDGFDFTLLFEETILTIPLLLLFLFAFPIRIVQLARTETKVLPSVQHWLKAVCGFLKYFF